MDLGTIGSLAVTNSPMHASKHEPKVVEGRVEIVYSFIVEGLGPEVVSVDLGKASVMAGNLPGDVVCSARGFTVDVLALGAAERWQVDCHIKLARDTTAALMHADMDVVLVVPVRQQSRTDPIWFRYWLSIEDAS
jgi:hypothetical protein